MVILETKNLKKSFGGLTAIDDVSLKIQSGSIHGLIGPNGSGKSTFFNLLTGVYRSDPGSQIKFLGEDITNALSHQIAAKGLARTFQLLRLFSELTVIENLMVGGHCRTNYSMLSPIFNFGKVQKEDSETHDRMMELLQVIGLADYADTPAGELSGGQRRLLAMGRAIAMNPKMLLLDEPGAGLSPVNVDGLMTTILSLKERYSLTIVVVEHILKVVMNTCETITVLDHGKKISEGSPSEVKDDPAVIEAYLGREMNNEDIRKVITAKSN